MKYSEEQKKEDSDTLDYHLKIITDRLKSDGLPVTNRNIVQGMYDCFMGDWIAGVDVCPICDYEGTKWDTP